MMHTLRWYQETQVNVFISIVQQNKIIKEMVKRLEQTKVRYNFREEQINMAIKKGKKSFDDERFMKKDAKLQEGVQDE